MQDRDRILGGGDVVARVMPKPDDLLRADGLQALEQGYWIRHEVGGDGVVLGESLDPRQGSTLVEPDPFEGVSQKSNIMLLKSSKNLIKSFHKGDGRNRNFQIVTYGRT